MNKLELLETLHTSRTNWNALLAEVGEEHMTKPGAAGHWSVKDIVCHITAYERWLVDWLTAASQNTFPTLSPLDDSDMEHRNARIYEMTRAMSLLDVMNNTRQTLAELLAVIEVLPDEYFT